MTRLTTPCRVDRGEPAWVRWDIPTVDGSSSDLSLGVVVDDDRALRVGQSISHLAHRTTEVALTFRCPVNGGGSGRHIYKALGPLAMTMARYKKPKTLEAATALAPRPFIHRHADEATGDLGMAIGEDGTITLALVHGKESMMRQNIWTMHHPDTTPHDIYKALGGLYDALEKDNTERPNYGGAYV